MERLLALACTSAPTTPPVVPEEGVMSNKAEDSRLKLDEDVLAAQVSGQGGSWRSGIPLTARD